MRRAVIDPTAAFRRHGDFSRILPHRKRSRNCRYRVVGHKRRTVRNSKRGIHTPGLGDAREIREGKGFTVRQGGQPLPAVRQGCRHFRRSERKRSAVIILLLRRRGKSNRPRRHLNRAVYGRDYIVLRLRVRIKRIFESIGARRCRICNMAHNREAGITRAFTGGKAVSSHRNCALAMRFTVIDPLRAAARQCHISRRNRPVFLNRP